MAKCDFCGKGVSFGIKVSHSHRRSNRMWKPNVKRVAAVVDGSPRHVHVCTRCLRSGKVTRAVQLLANPHLCPRCTLWALIIYYIIWRSK